MLINFQAQNIRSFSPTCNSGLSMLRASKSKEKPELVIDNPCTKSHLLRLGLIYGKNSTGKTNLLKSIRFLRQIMLKGIKADEVFHIPQFKFAQEPKTRFKLKILTACGELTYSLIINQQEVLEEKLYHCSNTGSDKIVFHRIQNKVSLGKTSLHAPNYLIEFITTTAERLRKNQLLLNKLMDDNFQKFNNEPYAQPYFALWTWFRNVNFVSPGSYFTDREFLASNMTSFISDFLHKINIPTKVKVESTLITDPLLQNQYSNLKPGASQAIIGDPNKGYIKREIDGLLRHYEIKFEKNGQIFSLQEESSGIQRLIELAPLLFLCTKGHLSSAENNEKGNYRTIFIDELGIRFHWNLLNEFIQTFIKSRNSQPFIQLICTTHDERLLDLVRTDCVHIAKMEDYGTTFETFKARVDGSRRNAWKKQIQL